MKIGLFFGTFNPIHVGHLIIANYMVAFTDLDRVWFVVSPHNPFKDKKDLLGEYDRLHLVHLATEDDDKLSASNVEFHLPQPSYTIDTLTHLHEKYPPYQFALIMGSDNLKTLPKWKNADAILKYHEIYVYTRPNHPASGLSEHPKVRVFDVPLLHISASFLRRSIRDGKSVRYFIPDKVLNYILEMHYYE